jgi:hypothetical protein
MRQNCADCFAHGCTIDGCPRYGVNFAGAYSLQRHMASCHSGDPKALTKTKELDVYLALAGAGVQFEYQKFLPFRGCGLNSESAHCFVDFAILTAWGVLLLECDEQQHSAYPASCDVRRDFDMCASIALGSQQKVVVLRYNPDSYHVNGATKHTSKKDRHSKLLETIEAFKDDPCPSLGFARYFLFYNKASDDARLPLISKEWEPEACKLSFCVRE